MPDATGKYPSHYEVLGLTSSATTSKQDVKTAYHRALLRYHPDKIPTTSSLTYSNARPERQATPLYSIDQITSAYNTLSNSSTRAAYDKQLELSVEITEKYDQKSFHDGLDTYDLEDMSFDDSANCWCRACRCGEEKGYTVTEAELERESKEGQIYVGCKGCSLWIKVLFSMIGGDT